MVCSPAKEKTLEMEERNVEEEIETNGVKENVTLKRYKQVAKRLVKCAIMWKSFRHSMYETIHKNHTSREDGC